MKGSKNANQKKASRERPTNQVQEEAAERRGHRAPAKKKASEKAAKEATKADVKPHKKRTRRRLSSREAAILLFSSLLKNTRIAFHCA